ncbi:hypothetical protein [Terricaulis sp.]|uniref:hypothetical protein n=1 Tax=Terricaulis sp. TaxID=2768686 RepID=UPI002AC4F37D|nr:hypothetical protein [Terricaulis sp.]MDZ4689828.1 hypothetical protein [Terricaulis sp.]
MTATPIRHAPLALWRIAQDFLHTLHMLFGAPEDVAFDHTLTHKQHALLLKWLRAGEALLRRLLLLEAAYYPPQPPRKPRAPHKRARVRMNFASDEPEKWRVSFRCFGDWRRSAPRGGQRRTLRFRSAWPLAERYEALLRVFNDPTGYARRLAARLRAAPHRRLEVLRETPYAEHLVGGYDEITQALAAPDTS